MVELLSDNFTEYSWIYTIVWIGIWLESTLDNLTVL